MDLLSKKIPKWCANRSQVLFFRPDAMSSTLIFVLTACNVATGRSFAKCGHHRLRTLCALFGGRGERRVTRKLGGFDLKVIPITNPPQRIGQPRIFDFKDPVYVKVKVMLAPAWVGREQERVSREQGTWHLWGCHKRRWSSEYERSTSQLHKSALPNCAQSMRRIGKTLQKTQKDHQIHILSACKVMKLNDLLKSLEDQSEVNYSVAEHKLENGQLGKLHHRTHGPRWFPTGFFFTYKWLKLMLNV